MATDNEYNKDNASKREGMLALSQSEKLTKQMDMMMYDNPFTTLLEVRRQLTPYCISQDYGPMVQNWIDEAIYLGLTWQNAYETKDYLRKVYEHEKMVRGGPDGPKNISQFGTLTAAGSGRKAGQTWMSRGDRL